jgi:plastocyanin
MRQGNRTGAWSIALAVAGVLGVAPALATTPRTVEIKEFRYAPTVLTVPVGTTVKWVNHDEEPHTVTSATGRFRSAGLEHDETFSQTFDAPGTYAYACALHPHMKATVVVK